MSERLRDTGLYLTSIMRGLVKTDDGGENTTKKRMNGSRLREKDLIVRYIISHMDTFFQSNSVNVHPTKSDLELNNLKKKMI